MSFDMAGVPTPTAASYHFGLHCAQTSNEFRAVQLHDPAVLIVLAVRHEEKVVIKDEPHGEYDVVNHFVGPSV